MIPLRTFDATQIPQVVRGARPAGTSQCLLAVGRKWLGPERSAKGNPMPQANRKGTENLDTANASSGIDDVPSLVQHPSS